MAGSNNFSGSFQIMKAGWLQRKSDFLRRWKPSWIVVYTNGDLKYFESPDKLQAEDTVVLPVEVKRVINGSQCGSSLPDNRSADCLFSLVTPDRKWDFCADSADDCNAWLLTIEEARRLRPASAPPQYSQQPPPAYSSAYSGAYSSAYQQQTAYPGAYAGAYPSQRVIYVENGCNIPARIIQQPDGNTIVIYEDGRLPYCHRHCCYGCRSCCYGDAALGLAAGALLFSPLMWWPLWC